LARFVLSFAAERRLCYIGSFHRLIVSEHSGESYGVIAPFGA